MSGRDFAGLFDLAYPPMGETRPTLAPRPGSLQALHAQFPDDESVLRYVFAIRFGSPAACPRCGKQGGWEARVPERAMRHPGCDTVVFPYKDTLFYYSQIPVRLWLYAMLHIANSASGANRGFLSRHLGLTEFTCARLLRKLRLHLAAIDHLPRVGSRGSVVHVRLERPGQVYMPNVRRRKIPQLLCFASEGRVRTVVTDSSHPGRLARLIAQRVERGARLVTECDRTMRFVTRYRTAFKRLEYQPEWFTGQPDEIDHTKGFISSFVRGLTGQHTQISMPNLWLYLKEYEFRYNRRHRREDIFSEMTNRYPLLTPGHIHELWNWNDAFRP